MARSCEPGAGAVGSKGFGSPAGHSEALASFSSIDSRSIFGESFVAPCTGDFDPGKLNLRLRSSGDSRWRA